MSTTLDTQHVDMIHDVQLDYYGKRIATCSSDRTIKIFNNSNQLLQTLLAHQGPVWQVKWAHPKFGSILASCSYDAQVFIWKEQAGKYSVIKEHLIHSSSVNSIDWAPHEIGLVLVSASSDGNLSILTFKDDGSWDVNTLNAHSIGANSVSWAPYNLVSIQESVKRFASGGCDNLIKLWTFQESWKLETTLSGHVDWVRDVAFSSSGVLASCGQDKQVFVWKLNNGNWKKIALKAEGFGDVVWRVSWSPCGNLLAVSCGDNKVTVWKENMDGQWSLVGDVNE